MNYARLLSVCSLILSLTLMPFPYSQAKAVTITSPIEHEGLTFDEPLTFSQQNLPTIALSFENKESLPIKAHTEKRVLAEAIVSPTPPTKKDSLPSLPSYLITPTPTLSKTNPTATPQLPTTVPTLTPTPTSIPTQAVASLANPGGLDAEKLFAMSNSYRAERGLPPFQKDERSCQLAAERAPEVAGEVASGALHSGLHARNLPYWNTENIISMRTEEEAFNWWINDHIHWKAIVGNFTYSCVACSGNNCAQEFTNYQPK